MPVLKYHPEVQLILVCPNSKAVTLKFIYTYKTSNQQLFRATQMCYTKVLTYYIDVHTLWWNLSYIQYPNH